ncbi:MAG TPA: 50S ribosomal protein L18a [Thermoplasmatales archaeon]|nr:50S ribosomal protein L18a [Thermoplasmatales archaeon]
MKAFRIEGSFKMGEKLQPFKKEIIAETKDSAIEKIYSVFGSRHRVKRKEIKIENIQELKEDDITDPITKYLFNKFGGKRNE